MRPGHPATAPRTTTGRVLAALALATAMAGLGPIGHPPAAVAAEPEWPSATEANAAIGNGIEVLSPCCGQDTVTGDIEARAAAVKEAGFTGVRYAVKFSRGQSPDPPYAMDPVYLDQIRAEIDAFTAQGLTVVLNNNESLDDPDRSGDRLVARWTQIAEQYADLPPSVYFEIANEPSWAASASFGGDTVVTADQWNALVARVIPVIRDTNPQRTIVVSSAVWSIPQAIPALVLPTDDGHLIATFHQYNPLPFTHQGSWIAGSDAWIGTTWTGTPDEVAALKDTMNGAVCWSRDTGIPLFLGEFSSYNAGTHTDQDPMRWNKIMVQLADAEDISWTYFLLNGTYDPETGRLSYDSLWDEAADIWNQPLLDTLDRARDEPLEPWAECDDDPTPSSTTTSPSAPIPATPSATPAVPVNATARFTG